MSWRTFHLAMAQASVIGGTAGALVGLAGLYPTRWYALPFAAFALAGGWLWIDERRRGT